MLCHVMLILKNKLTDVSLAILPYKEAMQCSLTGHYGSFRWAQSQPQHNISHLFESHVEICFVSITLNTSILSA